MSFDVPDFDFEVEGLDFDVEGLDFDVEGFDFEVEGFDFIMEEQNMSAEKRVARIFEEPTGRYHFCADVLDHLDARGPGYPSKAAAMRAALAAGFSHGVGSGTYHRGVRPLSVELGDKA